MAKDEYKKTAQEIVRIVGKDNIESVTHCVTRLRLSVEDRSKIDDDKIESLDLVKGVFYTGGQYQVILGTGIVDNVFEAIEEEYDFKQETKKNMEKKKQSGIQKAVRLIADVFIPIIPVLGATGLFLGLKGVLFNESVLGLFGLKPDMIPQYIQTLISVLTDTAFGFLPAFIAWSAFKSFGGTPIIGFLIGLMLVSPALPNAYEVAGGDAKPIMVAGFIPIIGYQGSILTALFAGIVGAKLEKRLRKVMPSALDLIFTPFFVILIIMIFSFFIMGPIVHGIESFGITLVKAFIDLPFGIGGFLIGFIYPLAVMTGLHHMFIIVETSLLASTGFNPLITLAAMYGFSNAGVCLALALSSKKASFKTAGISATVTQLLGVSEPALFGVVLRSGIRALGIMLFCSSIGGGILALLKIKANSYGLAVILSPLMYIYDFSQLLTYVIVGILIFILGFTLTKFFGISKHEEIIDGSNYSTSENEEDNNTNVNGEQKLARVGEGKIIPLREVEDPVFSQKLMGEGYAFEPSNPNIYSPIEGTVVFVSDSKHAIGIKDKYGIEVLIHMGIDTVEIKENVFDIKVEVGYKVSTNDLIANMNVEKIQYLGKLTTTMVVITNSQEKIKSFRLKDNLNEIRDNIIAAYKLKL